jgi:chemotaxis protein MotB
MSRRSKGNNTFLLALGDLITVLMIFFIYLYSISEIDPIKFIELKQYFQEQAANDSGSSDMIDEIIAEQEQIKTIAKELEQLLEAEELEDQVTIKHEKQKLFLTLGNSLLFRTAQSSLKTDNHRLLVHIASILQKTKSRVIIEGHTDNLPIKTDNFQSNWELSLSRAESVFNFFVKAGMDEQRFVISGYGEHAPLVDNNTRENRAKNRRVTIVIEPQMDNFTLPGVKLEGKS